MRIRDIVPVRSPKVMEGMAIQRQQWARPDVEIEVVPIERGPFSMEFATEEVLAGPYILEAVRKAENDGVDAVVLDCCVDPVLRAARETVRIPVMAPAHSGLHVASMLGYRIAILGMRNGQQALEEHIRATGSITRYAPCTSWIARLPILSSPKHIAWKSSNARSTSPFPVTVPM